MKPYDNIPDPRFFSAEESPIPLPPVDESWALLQKRLEDERTRPRGIAWWWWMLAGIGILTGGLALWTGGHRSSETPSLHTHLQAGAGTQETTARRSPGQPSSAAAPGAGNARASVATGGTAAGAANGSGDRNTANGAGRPGASGNRKPERSVESPSGAAGGGRRSVSGAGGINSTSGNRESGAAGINGTSKGTSLWRAGGKNLMYCPFGIAQDALSFPEETDTAFISHHPLAGGKMEIQQMLPGAFADPGVRKGAKNSAKNGAKNGNLRMAAGLALLQNAPLGDQLIYDYNINGKSNLASDYIPAPYFQYFLNRNWYIEVALRWNSPQYMPSVPIDSLRTKADYNHTVFTTSTLQKLYYTDIPLTVGYSPMTHLFLGGGIQYSGLRGGFVYQRIVSYDSVSLLPLVYRTGRLTKSMEETLQLKATDWRILLEANYYWKRFSLGLRYQQPLGGF